MENKKIKNSKAINYNGITFKSQLEKVAYKTLVDKGFVVFYEDKKFIIWEGIRHHINFYDGTKHTTALKTTKEFKLRDITYTPDFLIEYQGKLIIIEMKGIENDVFPVKKKLFLKFLTTSPGIEYKNHIYTYENIYYFELRNKKQVEEMITILNKNND